VLKQIFDSEIKLNDLTIETPTMDEIIRSL